MQKFFVAAAMEAYSLRDRHVAQAFQVTFEDNLSVFSSEPRKINSKPVSLYAEEGKSGICGRTT